MKKILSMRLLGVMAIAAIALSNVLLSACSEEDDLEMNSSTLAKGLMTRSGSEVNMPIEQNDTTKKDYSITQQFTAKFDFKHDDPKVKTILHREIKGDVFMEIDSTGKIIDTPRFSFSNLGDVNVINQETNYLYNHLTIKLEAVIDSMEYRHAKWEDTYIISL